MGYGRMPGLKMIIAAAQGKRTLKVPDGLEAACFAIAVASLTSRRIRRASLRNSFPKSGDFHFPGKTLEQRAYA